MTEERYPKEAYNEDDEDYKSGLPTDYGRMQENLDELAEKVVGHRIVSARKLGVNSDAEHYWDRGERFEITLDNETRVLLADTDDCCAYTTLETFLLNANSIDHIITGVGSTDGFESWHIFADMGDVLQMTVGWSCGNPFYYSYGLTISVEPLPQETSK